MKIHNNPSRRFWEEYFKPLQDYPFTATMCCWFMLDLLKKKLYPKDIEILMDIKSMAEKHLPDIEKWQLMFVENLLSNSVGDRGTRNHVRLFQQDNPSFVRSYALFVRAYICFLIRDTSGRYIYRLINQLQMNPNLKLTIVNESNEMKHDFKIDKIIEFHGNLRNYYDMVQHFMELDAEILNPIIEHHSFNDEKSLLDHFVKIDEIYKKKASGKNVYTVTRDQVEFDIDEDAFLIFEAQDAFDLIDDGFIPDDMPEGYNPKVIWVNTKMQVLESEFNGCSKQRMGTCGTVYDTHQHMDAEFWVCYETLDDQKFSPVIIASVASDGSNKHGIMMECRGIANNLVELRHQYYLLPLFENENLDIIIPTDYYAGDTNLDLTTIASDIFNYIEENWVIKDFNKTIDYWFKKFIPSISIDFNQIYYYFKLNDIGKEYEIWPSGLMNIFLQSSETEMMDKFFQNLFNDGHSYDGEAVFEIMNDLNNPIGKSLVSLFSKIAKFMNKNKEIANKAMTPVKEDILNFYKKDSYFEVDKDNVSINLKHIFITDYGYSKYDIIKFANNFRIFSELYFSEFNPDNESMWEEDALDEWDDLKTEFKVDEIFDEDVGDIITVNMLKIFTQSYIKEFAKNEKTLIDVLKKYVHENYTY